jgi:hypothetical protein
MGITKEIRADIYLFLEDNIDRLIKKYPGSEGVITAILFEYVMDYTKRVNAASSGSEE